MDNKINVAEPCHRSQIRKSMAVVWIIAIVLMGALSELTWIGLRHPS